MTQPGYSIDGLTHGIERCKVNIESLEKAMANERNQIKEYKIMIDDLLRAKKDHAEAKRLSRTIEVPRKPAVPPGV